METTTAILNQLVNYLADQYAEELSKFPIKKALREAMIDGFRAGAHGAVRHTCAMLEVKVNA